MHTIEYDKVAIFNQIQEIIESHPVVVYMKGSAEIPMCGFSGYVIQILKQYSVTIFTINVLDDIVIRQAIKDFNQWPTVPQIFVNGEFIGGCDILKDMHASGELTSLFASVVSA